MSSNWGRSATWRWMVLTIVLADGFGARARGGDGLAKTRVADSIAGGVHRVGDAVGIKDHGFAGLECRFDHLVRVVGHDCQGQARLAPAEFFEAAVAAADQGARVARVDDVKPMQLDVENDQQERDVQVEHTAIFKLVVELLDDARGVGLPRRNILTSADSLAVSKAAGIPLPTTSPTAIAHRVAMGRLPGVSAEMGMMP